MKLTFKYFLQKLSCNIPLVVKLPLFCGDVFVEEPNLKKEKAKTSKEERRGKNDERCERYESEERILHHK